MDTPSSTMCGTLCLQHCVNQYLDEYRKGRLELVTPSSAPPKHLNFV
jgi:hypothetical protein